MFRVWHSVSLPDCGYGDRVGYSVDRPDTAADLSRSDLDQRPTRVRRLRERTTRR